MRILLGPALLAAVLAAGPARAASHGIVIEALRFEPAALQVRPGDKVTWTNRDPFPHTVTADGGQFDSGPIPPGKSWTWRARKAENIPYHCVPHPTMKAGLAVQ